MISKFNQIFWRNKTIWLLSLSHWGYGNIPAIIKYWNDYESTIQFIVGVVISMSFIPISIGIFYLFAFIVNILLKQPILIDVVSENAEIKNESIVVYRGGVDSYIHFDSIKKIILKKEYLSIYTNGGLSPEIILKVNIGKVDFDNIVNTLISQKMNYHYKIEKTTKLWGFLLAIYALSAWLLWFQFKM